MGTDTLVTSLRVQHMIEAALSPEQQAVLGLAASSGSVFNSDAERAERAKEAERAERRVARKEAARLRLATLTSAGVHVTRSSEYSELEIRSTLRSFVGDDWHPIDPAPRAEITSWMIGDEGNDEGSTRSLRLVIEGYSQQDEKARRFRRPKLTVIDYVYDTKKHAFKFAGALVVPTNTDDLIYRMPEGLL